MKVSKQSDFEDIFKLSFRANEVMDGKFVPVSLPIILSREGKWFVAACPLLNIASQGKSEKEVHANLAQLITEYFEDPDTQKPSFSEMASTSVSVINMPINVRVSYGKIASVKTN